MHRPAHEARRTYTEGMMLRRTMALDVGNKRIGVALSDALGLTAQPLLTVWRTTLRADLKSLARLSRRYEVATIVVGLPVHASGDASKQSERTEIFVEALRSHLAAADTPMPEIVLLDERHTTREAHELLNRTRGVPHTAADREERTKVIDQAAAAVLLQTWLERQAPALLPDPDGNVFETE